MPARRLTERAYELFAAKGPETAVRVRRIVGLVSAVCARGDDWQGLRVLDLGCGEGVFAIEAALHGARVVAVDVRDERMAAGRTVAEELRLANVDFVEADVQTYPFEDHGPFDVILFLGLLYHLDAPALFDVTRRAAAATTRALIVETHVAERADEEVQSDGETYRGWRYREHRADDVADVRSARLLASSSNDASLWLTPASLFALLGRHGFPTILQSHAPAQPFEADDRFTLVALKSESPTVITLPWINAASIEDVQRRSRPPAQLLFMPPQGSARDDAVRRVLVTLGAWVDAHSELVLGTYGNHLAATMHAPDAALWRRADLDQYVGWLRRVPPVLAVAVADAADEAALRANAAAYLAAGVATVWLALLPASTISILTRDGERTFSADETLPAPAGLAGLSPRVSDFLRAR